MKEILDIVLLTGGTMVDLGCGTGDLIEGLAEGFEERI